VLVTFDPLAQGDPYSSYAELRRSRPVYRIDGELERVATHNTRGVARLPIAVG
jgi:hypothetical protein